MENITFKLIKIEIPTGTGKTVNRIISVDSKRSIIQIRNKDTSCLARSTVVALATLNRGKLQDIFRERLSEEEVKKIIIEDK